MRRRTITKFTGSRISAAKKQRLIDTTKVLLDIAKESSDACAPLKSCLGGICALIKHYEVRSRQIGSQPCLVDLHLPQESKDVEEKLGDLIPWLNKLKGSVTTARPDDSREEAERHEQLTRFVSRLLLVDSS